VAGLGVLLLSHDLDLVRALATRVVVLSAGRVIVAGGTDVLPESPELKSAGTTTAGQPLLQAMNLTASLRPRGRDRVLHELDFAVRAGSCLGIVGRSASGKTSDQVLVIDAGRVVEQGTPERVMTHSVSQLTRRLVRAVHLGHPLPPPLVISTTRSDAPDDATA
jgi:peptide/nickel transport system ATP-binding protein